MLNFHTHRPQADETATRSTGLHPWHLAADTLPADLSHVESQLRVGCYQLVGECGIDRCCNTPLPLQLQAFWQQLLWAEQYRLPVVVHCVRAYDLLLQMRRSTLAAAAQRFALSAPSPALPARWQQPWVVHGFVGTPQLAMELQQAGILVSFGAALLDERRSKPRQALLAVGAALTPYRRHEQQETCPAARFFLETDDSPCTIRDVYHAAATLLHIPVPRLCLAIDHAFAALQNPQPLSL